MRGHIETGVLAGLVALMISVAWDALTNEEPAIEVHDLSVITDVQGVLAVRQNRTVRGRRAVWVVWEAEVRQAAPGTTICAGTGHWRYPRGTRVAVIEFTEWVGDPGCLGLLTPGVTLQVCATYNVADRQPETACSLGFRVTPAGRLVETGQ